MTNPSRLIAVLQAAALLLSAGPTPALQASGIRTAPKSGSVNTGPANTGLSAGGLSPGNAGAGIQAIRLNSFSLPGNPSLPSVGGMQPLATPGSHAAPQLPGRTATPLALPASTVVKDPATPEKAASNAAEAAQDKSSPGKTSEEGAASDLEKLQTAVQKLSVVHWIVCDNITNTEQYQENLIFMVVLPGK